jgi:hypothetical protein
MVPDPVKTPDDFDDDTSQRFMPTVVLEPAETAAAELEFITQCVNVVVPDVTVVIPVEACVTNQEYEIVPDAVVILIGLLKNEYQKLKVVVVMLI